jgi:hypothetical protein
MVVLTGSPHEKELIAMGTAPHRVDSQHEGPSAGPEADGEPRIPQPLPQADRRGRMAVIVMLAVLAIIVLVVLL